ncbi:hypothetical protein ACSNOB_10815 [Micromonospora sp. URMC 106]|uniref:hypothetical protein n=1 Tax=Micromonospora sp. URMC 106 TaxID=3423408 RepID=UPI003F1CBEC7
MRAVSAAVDAIADVDSVPVNTAAAPAVPVTLDEAWMPDQVRDSLPGKAAIYSSARAVPMLVVIMSSLRRVATTYARSGRMRATGHDVRGVPVAHGATATGGRADSAGRAGIHLGSCLLCTR